VRRSIWEGMAGFSLISKSGGAGKWRITRCTSWLWIDIIGTNPLAVRSRVGLRGKCERR
jgi:hypothetical protein